MIHIINLHIYHTSAALSCDGPFVLTVHIKAAKGQIFFYSKDASDSIRAHEHFSFPEVAVIESCEFVIPKHGVGPLFDISYHKIVRFCKV